MLFPIHAGILNATKRQTTSDKLVLRATDLVHALSVVQPSAMREVAIEVPQVGPNSVCNLLLPYCHLRAHCKTW